MTTYVEFNIGNEFTDSEGLGIRIVGKRGRFFWKRYIVEIYSKGNGTIKTVKYSWRTIFDWVKICEN